MPRAVILLFAIVFATGLARAAEEEWVRTSTVHLPGLEPRDAEGRKTVVSVRLFREDGAGGLVLVPHGLGSYYTEESHPTAPGARLLARGKGDEWGFVNVVMPGEPRAPDERGFHWHFEAPGQGATHETGRFGWLPDEEITLPGGEDIEILVIDPFGRPIAGALVSQFLGCPHSPTLRRGVTDERGIVRLANLPADRNDDFWVEAPGIDRGPYYTLPPRIGESRPRILLEPARTVRGRVVDESGDPLAGVVVRTAGYPRGPIVLTDERGGFVLDGVPWAAAVYFYRPGRPEPDCIVRDFVESIPIRVALRKDRPTSLTDGEARHLVTVVAAGGGIRTPVVLSRLSDGFTVRGTIEEGMFRTEVPPGRYRVEAGGGFSGYLANAVEADLPRPDAAPVRVPVSWGQAEASFRLHRGGGADPGRPLEFRVPGRSRDVSKWINSLPHRPPGVPAGLLVSNPTRILPVEGGRVDLWPVPMHEIRFRLHNAAGSPVEPDLAFIDNEVRDPEAQKDGSWILRTWRCGRITVSFFEPFGAAVGRTLDLPADRPAKIDLGTLVVPADEEEADPWTFRLRYADGALVTEDDLRWLSVVAECEPDWADWESLDVDKKGLIAVEDGRPTVRFRIQATRIYPFAAEVRRDGPREVRLPPGRLTGTVRDADGELVAAALFVDSYRFDAPAGRIDIHALPPGPHIVIAGAPGHLTEIRRILQKDGETRAIEVRLEPR
ncbi:MAG: carboxypeptidase-like regulatory domain-containing protein [Planctomycetota bacterium]